MVIAQALVLTGKRDKKPKMLPQSHQDAIIAVRPVYERYELLIKVFEYQDKRACLN
jgi:hypothetical protein